MFIELKLYLSFFSYYYLTHKPYMKYEASVKPRRGQTRLDSKRNSQAETKGILNMQLINPFIDEDERIQFKDISHVIARSTEKHRYYPYLLLWHVWYPNICYILRI